MMCKDLRACVARGLMFWCVLLVVCLGSLPASSWALQPEPTQESTPADVPATTPADNPQVADTPAPNAALPAAGAPAAATPAATTPPTTAGEKKNLLYWMIEASGIFGAAILLTSLAMVTSVVMNLLSLQRDVMVPPDFIEEFEAKLNAKDFQGAFDLAKADDSTVARVVAAGLGAVNRGYDEAVEAMQEVGEEETMGAEHKLSHLALIGSVAPMLGLMGTVYGMILSFREIATREVAPKPKELADGISTALFTTLEGLIVAIPAIVAYSLLRNRMARLMLDVGIVSTRLMGRFAPAVRKTERTTQPG